METSTKRGIILGPTARKMIMALALAAVVGSVATGPARAEDDDCDEGPYSWRAHEWHQQAWREQDAYAYPAPGYVYGVPSYVYAPPPPPPVVYAAVE